MTIANHNYSCRAEPEGGFKTLESFYPYYLSEHCNQTNRRLHISGTTITVLLIILAILKQRHKLLLAAPLQGYGFAWIGHILFEKNKPATFRYPIYSLISDFKMWSEVMSGKRKF